MYIRGYSGLILIQPIRMHFSTYRLEQFISVLTVDGSQFTFLFNFSKNSLLGFSGDNDQTLQLTRHFICTCRFWICPIHFQNVIVP